MSGSVFGIAEKAIHLSEERSVMLADNLVNASTPHYKARDFDFHKALQGLEPVYNLEKTNAMHIQPDNQVDGVQMKYRVPMQMSMDGNTVDDEVERKNFIENAMRYQVSLTFIQNKSDELMKSIRGE